MRTICDDLQYLAKEYTQEHVSTGSYKSLSATDCDLGWFTGVGVITLSCWRRRLTSLEQHTLIALATWCVLNSRNDLLSMMSTCKVRHKRG